MNKCWEKARKTVSISTRKGRRAICNNCGTPWKFEKPEEATPLREARKIISKNAYGRQPFPPRNRQIPHSQPEETTTSQAILLDMYEREGLVGIEKHIAKERTLAKKEILNQVLDIIHETDPSTGRGTSKIYWGNVLREKVSALLPEQESHDIL